MKIPLTIPSFDKEEETAVAKVLRSGWVTQGPKVAEFEEEIAAYTGAKYAVATTSATTSLFLSLYMLGIGEGDEVILPSFTFIATANVVASLKAKPVFVDIDPKTYNIDPRQIEKAITKKTKAIMPVDQVGLPADLKSIVAIAKKHKLYVVEDAACGFASIYDGYQIGSYPGVHLICLSFHPRKSITTGEGGMILTQDKKLADRAKVLRHHGMSVSDLTRYKSKKIMNEKYYEIGFNFRMSDIQAAVGLEQLKKLPKFLKIRKRIADKYTKVFSNYENIIPPFVPDNCIPNWQSYVIKLRNSKRSERDRIMQKLLDSGIATRRGVMAAHMEPAYQKLLGKVRLPITEESANTTISLPLFTTMKAKEQKYVIKKVLEFTRG
ncbi:MAG: DegT/DnrJ/EryC1/StrS aminotransferase [Microgenomates group bacterium GW2011_GWA2_37_6]|nr:MAG: DegT/DnrJ/EryC1/StrS aminotransferase [Microgenomates group bacterium GW2011_GWA2_37_6]